MKVLMLWLICFGFLVKSKDDAYFSEKFSSFLSECSDPENNLEYGYNGIIDEIRKNQMSHLDDVVYLDYTGSGLYQEKQIDRYRDLLKENLFGNTHSRSSSSRRSELVVEEARQRILSFLNTTSEEYSVIFTSGATGALKIISESFPWSEDSLFLYTNENHNSVLGIRQIVIEEGGSFQSISESEFERILSNQTPIKREDDNELSQDDAPSNFFFGDFDNTKSKFIKKNRKQKVKSSKIYNLFGYPPESNFSGRKYPMDWIREIIIKQDRHLSINNGLGEWYVLIDAAAFVPTNNLDLSTFPADFVTLSFYKMFGFPTGLGALIVKNSVAEILLKRYFGGGTVSVASCDTNYCKFKNSPSGKFEDGSINFLSIAALKFGFDVLDELGLEKITSHVNILTLYLYNHLISLKHTSTGTPVVKVYGNHPEYEKRQGSIISFNILLPDGSLVGHESVMHAASEQNIHIRSGQHCNPGAVKIHLGWSENQFQKFAADDGECGFDNFGFQKNEKVATGSVRVSIGYLTNFEDVQIFLDFVIDNYIM